MKPKYSRQTNIMQGGWHEWERTDQYRELVRKIVREVTEKYSARLSQERSWFRRFIINIRVEIEIKKRIKKLTSSRNLHAIGSLQSFR